MIDTSVEHYFEIVAKVTFFASVIHAFLPPWDWASDYPRCQRVYKAFVYIVGYAAGNFRSTVFKTISINNPDGVNTTGVSTTTTKIPVEVTTVTETKPQ